MRNAKLGILALIAVFAFGALAVASASAVQPEFNTESGKTLSFSASGGLATLLGEELKVRAEIMCEKSSTTGEILNKTPLADNIAITFTGKCKESIAGGTASSCTEPITVKPARGEIGLAAKEEVGIVLKPYNSAGEFVETTCGSNKTTVDGEIIGLYPETKNYNKLEKSAEQAFNAKGTTQEPTEIELLGVKMTKVELKVSGAFGEKSSQITIATVTNDGGIEIKT